MSVRTFDPRPAEIFPTARCSAGCGKEYYSICRYCNLAYCFDHLKTLPHACDTKWEYIVLTPEEVEELFCDQNETSGAPGFCCSLPENWDPSPKGCFEQHPRSGEICQLPAGEHLVHKRIHPNGTELECWVARNGSTVK